jgi:membrane protein YqaA with SNARE-associated domain
MELSPRINFLIRNSIKGFIWLFILFALYYLFHDVVFEKNPEIWVQRFYGKPIIIYGIYFASEFFFGIFPPELFMLWAINKGTILHYFFNVLFFAGVSYAFGYITFLIGQFISKLVFFRYLRIKFFKKSWIQLRKYGLFLIIIAAMTPVPWSATCLLVGAAGYPSSKFLLYALSRILRFSLYGYIVFQTHQI